LSTLALVLAIICFIVGMIGTILPLLPGVVLVYFGILLYGIMTHFTTLHLGFFIIQTIILVIVFASDYLSAALGAKVFGGSKQAMAGAIVGTILAIILLGPAGIIIGPIAGAFIVELIRGVEVKKALQVGFGTLIGVIGGTLFKLAAELVMIIYFFMAAF